MKENLKKHLYLIGMMGAGKTTVGKRLAQIVGCPFYDIDREIEKKTGVSINTIFELEGEAGFRRRECDMLKAVSERAPSIISTGGGAIVNPLNQALIAQGHVLYLSLSLADVLERTKEATHRPLAGANVPVERIATLLEARKPIYERLATLEISASQQHWSEELEHESLSTFFEQFRASRLHKVTLSQTQYEVRVGRNLLENLMQTLRKMNPSSVHVVTNETIAPLHWESLKNALDCEGLTYSLSLLPDGEKFKNLQTLTTLIEEFSQSALNRQSIVLAFGGGVIGDIAGFASAIYMRGIRVVQVPTTLLAQVDASVGGKTGVNLAAGKNLIGAFHQPSAVSCDVNYLKTLPQREYVSGLAEVIKHALLMGDGAFETLSNSYYGLLMRESSALISAVSQACEIKSKIVQIDEKEQGVRAILNLGHSFGHAIEKLAGYGTFLHGEAVGLGLLLALRLSEQKFSLNVSLGHAVTHLLIDAGLPTKYPLFEAKSMIEAMKNDKKNQNKILRLVLLEAIGKPIIVNCQEEEILSFLQGEGFL